MTGFTTNQWAILALVLLLGWLLGLMSRSGGGKWRRSYEAERSDALRTRAEADARLATANARIAELERSQTTAPVPVPAPAMTPTPVTTPVETIGDRDDLARIRGIGQSGATQLNGLGIHRYADITALNAADEAALEGRMGADSGYIARERWREQAELLAAGRADDHRRIFG